jgi:hypothetical protein
MVNYGDLQFPERIMAVRRSEMSAEWKVRFAISIASVAIQAFTKLLFSFSDVLKATNCTFQEVNNTFRLAVGIAVYDEFFSSMCAADQYKENKTNNRVSSHTILCSVIYPTSFVSTGQPYKNTHNCEKFSKNHPSWLSGNLKV